MRTTLELDDDVVASAKEQARQRGLTLGRVISDLTRQSLAVSGQPRMRNGALLLEPVPGAPRPTLEFINKLRDEE